MNEKKSGRGGPDRGQGRHPLPPGKRRIKFGRLTLAPRTVILARSIAEKEGHDMWWHVLDVAVEEKAERMGIE